MYISLFLMSKSKLLQRGKHKEQNRNLDKTKREFKEQLFLAESEKGDR